MRCSGVVQKCHFGAAGHSYPRLMAEAPTSLRIVAPFAALCVLLLLGHLLRKHVRLLRAFYVPASLLGGIIGLVLIQLVQLIPGGMAVLRQEVTLGWDEVPNFLISVVFGCLFLGDHIPPISDVWRVSGPQLMYGQILAWGQYAIPALVTGAVLVPALGVTKLIAPTVALGFEGGHGTAAGIKATFDQLGYPEGGNLALCSATVGLISGVLLGTVVINWAARRNLIATASRPDHNTFNGVYTVALRPLAGYQTVTVDALDSMALHVAIVGITLAFGYGVKRALLVAEDNYALIIVPQTVDNSAWLTEYGFFSAFPMFPFAMAGGILVQLVCDRFTDPSPIDRATIERISGLALDFTVVSAIADMRFDGLEGSLGAFAILLLVTWGWHLFCFFVLAPRLLPDSWVERAVAELGQSMGVTSTGLLLLRMADPENKTPALMAFSYKQLIHEPIVGGGLWTASVLPFIASAGIWPAVGVTWGVLLLWAGVYFFHFRPLYRRRGNSLALAQRAVLSEDTAPLLDSSSSIVAELQYGSTDM